MNFEQIEQYIKDARDLIAQKATLKDVATIRKTLMNKSNNIVPMSKATKTKSRLSTNSPRVQTQNWQRLTSGIKNKIKPGRKQRPRCFVVDWPWTSRWSNFRECLTYCLQNLADARCSALLTALGITSDDKKTILNNMKRIHSDSRSESQSGGQTKRHFRQESPCPRNQSWGRNRQIS